jgi:hypothetical protein
MVSWHATFLGRRYVPHEITVFEIDVAGVPSFGNYTGIQSKRVTESGRSGST